MNRKDIERTPEEQNKTSNGQRHPEELSRKFTNLSKFIQGMDRLSESI